MHNNNNWKPGDIANGYILNEQGQWVPYVSPVVPARKRKFSDVQIAVVTVLITTAALVVGSLASSGPEEKPVAAAPQYTAPVAPEPEWTEEAPEAEEESLSGEDLLIRAFAYTWNDLSSSDRATLCTAMEVDPAYVVGSLRQQDTDGIYEDVSDSTITSVLTTLC